MNATDHAAIPRRSCRQSAATTRLKRRARSAKGRDHARRAAEVEDREIEKVIRKQEEIGLKLATDGEFRRSWWHFDFFGGLDGVESIPPNGIQFAGVQTKAEGIKSTARSACPATRCWSISNS